MKPADGGAWALTCEDLRFTYRGAATPALDGMSLRVPANRFVGIVGRGGAGKSTLLRCCNRIIPEFFHGDLQGEIRVLGKATDGRRVHQMARRVGMVFQDFDAQLFSSTVELEVGFGPEQFGADPEELRRRVSKYLALTGLEQYQGRDPARLSGGEKQRLVIASVLAMETEVILLDEPTTDLDPVGRRQVWDLIRSLSGTGTAVIAAVHDTEVLENCSEIFVLSGGRVAFRGQPAEVLTRFEELQELGIAAPPLARIASVLTDEPSLPGSPEECRELIERRDIRPSPGLHLEFLKRESTGSPDPGPEILRLQEVSFSYPDGPRALEAIDLAVGEGEFLALLGSNGSGKTTLAKHLNGLLQPDRGKVLWRGTNIRDYRSSEMGCRVGFVFQNPDHQIFSASVWEEAAFAPRNLGLDRREIATRVEESLTTVGLDGKKDADPFLLTKGERQRLAVASVLAARPPVLVLDEPTTGLDPPSQERMMRLLERLNRGGHTLIIITHALSLAARFAGRCVLMAGGRIVADGPTRRLFGSENLLERAGLRQPPVTRLGRLYGETYLGLEEFLHACGRAAPDTVRGG